MRIAHVVNNKVHSIFESKTIPKWPADADGNPVVLIDITDKQQVKVGWDYNAQTGEFTEPIVITAEPQQPAEQEIIQAELMLNQAQILANQQSQDEVLATILLEQARGQANV